MKSCWRILILLLCTVSSISVAQSRPPADAAGESTIPFPVAPLMRITDELKSNSTAEQYQLISGAIDSSLALSTQMNELANAGLLTHLMVESPDTQIFGARIDGTSWLFTPAFLREQASKRLYDVVAPDDILPNNMVFALGHLAFHARNVKQFAANVDAIKKASTTNMAAALPLLIQLRLQEEAQAFIQGWNDVIDAAVQQNHGVLLTGNQGGNLILNLRHRWLFLKVSEGGANLFSVDGHIDPSAENIEAIVGVLHNSEVIDIQ